MEPRIKTQFWLKNGVIRILWQPGYHRVTQPGSCISSSICGAFSASVNSIHQQQMQNEEASLVGLVLFGNLVKMVK